MLSAWLAAMQRNPFPQRGCASRAVCTFIHRYLCLHCVCVSACAHRCLYACAWEHAHLCACVPPAGTLGTCGLNVVLRFGDVCGSVSVLWVLEQSQAGVDTPLSTRSREGMWAPGGQPGWWSVCHACSGASPPSRPPRLNRTGDHRRDFPACLQPGFSGLMTATCITGRLCPASQRHSQAEALT